MSHKFSAFITANDNISWMDKKKQGYYSVKNLQANCVCENSNFYYKFYVEGESNGMRGVGLEGG